MSVNPLEDLKQSVTTYKDFRSRLIESYPEIVDDPECLMDTLDGISNVKEQMEVVVRSAVTDEALADGLQNLIRRMVDRMAHLRDRARRKRHVVLNHMADLGFRNFITPDMTVTIRRVPPAVVVIDETKIPDAYCRFKREADKVKLKKALNEGIQIEGAILGNSSETLQVKI